MMVKSNKSLAISGMIWTFVDKLSTQVCQFVIGIVLARLLMPEDYGIIGMLAIFMAIAQSLLDSGFNRALIQKKDRSDIDYSTVFYFNLVISLFLYFIFYSVAPLIASFYEIPLLTDVTRVIFFVVVINSLSLVQTAKLTIELNFKLQTIASLCSVVISGAIGIILAYHNYGVWSLVAQTLSSAFIRTSILWITSKWKPLCQFSMQSFKSLFSFGSKLLIGDFIHTIYTNLYTLVIGKAFNASSVGYYNRSNGYAALPFGVFSQVVNKVMFPILSQKQDNNEELLKMYGKLLKVPMFLYIPLMFGIAALAEPLIVIMIGEKWVQCVPLLQILCVGYIFNPLTSLNLNLLYVKGRSDISLKLDLIKKPIGLLILFATIPFGLWWMCFGKTFYDFLAFAMNCYYTKKLLNYGFVEQLRDVLPIIVNSCFMFLIMILAIPMFYSYWAKLIFGFIIGTLLYLAIARLYKEQAFLDLYRIIKEKFTKYA